MLAFAGSELKNRHFSPNVPKPFNPSVCFPFEDVIMNETCPHCHHMANKLNFIEVTTES